VSQAIVRSMTHRWRPSFWLDEVFREDILNGIYPTPLHADGVNRVDLRDAAEVLATALIDEGFAAGTYSVVGPESINGEEIARVWSEELGHPVRYTGDQDTWRDSFRARLSGQKLDDWIKSFELLGSMPSRRTRRTSKL
jgi:uncharacterized protein YbjT (DUF2867 family)